MKKFKENVVIAETAQLVIGLISMIGSVEG